MTQEENNAELKFWKKFEDFAKKVLFNRKVLWSALLVIIIGVGTTVFLVMQNDKKHRQVRKLYITALEKYGKIQAKMDNINLERAGIAISALEKVNKTGGSFPENYLAYYNLGSIYAALGKEDLAIKYFSKLKDADSDLFICGKAMVNLAKIYQSQAKKQKKAQLYAKAVKIYQNLIDNYKNFYKDVAYFNLAMVYEAQDKIDMAITAYKSVRKTSRLYAEAKKNIEVLNRLQRIKKK